MIMKWKGRLAGDNLRRYVDSSEREEEAEKEKNFNRPISSPWGKSRVELTTDPNCCLFSQSRAEKKNV